MTLFTTLIIVFVCLAFEIFFSGSEIALISINRMKLHRDSESGSFSAKKIEKMLKNPEEIFGTTSLGTNISVVIAVSTATAFLVSLYGESGDLYATLIMAPITLLVGEIIPKSIFQEWADTAAYAVIHPLLFARRLFSPLLLITSKLTNLMLYILTGKKEGGTHFITRDEIIQLMRLGEKRLKLSPKEKKMIHNIFEFRETTVKECMVPLIELAAMNENNSLQTARKIFLKANYSRIPVFKDRICQITGILNYFDLIVCNKEISEIASLVHPPYFVPETKKVNELLKELQVEGAHMAVVVNEYGGTIGIVTIEDMLEEIVGEIHDEFDEGENLFEKQANGSLLVEARMEIDTIQDQLGISIPKGDYETLGGFLLDRFQKIPQKQEYLETEGVGFTIIESEKSVIKRVKVDRLIKD